MRKIVTRYLQILFTILMSLSGRFAFAQTVDFKDSLQHDMINYLESVEAYDQAMNTLQKKESPDSADLLHFYLLWKTKERIKTTEDSINLVSAESYLSKGLTEEALSIFQRLRSSSRITIRNRAIIAVDSIVTQKVKPWYTDYPWTSFPLKPLIPWLIVCLIPFLIFLIINISKNKDKIGVDCLDKEELTAFLYSIQLMRNELTSELLEEQRAGVVSPGFKRVLPYVDSEAIHGFKELVSVVAPSEVSKIINFIWTTGVNPHNKLHILIDRHDQNIIVTAQLLKGKNLIQKWYKTATKTTLPECRLDIVYEALMLLKK